MRRGWILSVLLLISACESGSHGAEETGAHAADGSEAAPVEVLTAAVQTHVFAETFEATGSLEPSRSVQVAANVAGRVMQVMVDRGDRVAEGDIIALIDNRTARRNREAAELQRQLAEAQAQQARRDCERAVQLLSEGVIAPADAQALETRCQVTELQVEAADAQVGVVDVVVGDATVRAPFAGVVGNAMTEVGAFVQPPSPVIDLQQIDPLTLVVALPAMHIGQVDLGQRVLVDFPDLLGVSTREATVSRVAPSLSPMTRSLPVEVTVPNADAALRGGLFARARFVAGSREALALPADAVVERDGRLRAYRVRDAVVEEVIVDRQEPHAGFYRAPATLEAGDTVVLRPSADVRDGTRVIPTAAAVPTPTPTPSSGSGAE